MNTVASNVIYDLLQTGQLEEAERLARGNLRTLVDDEGTLFLLALSLQQQRRLEESIEVYARLAKLFPQSKDHVANHATALRESGRLSEAETAYQRALQLSPGDPLVSCNLGLLHMERAYYVTARRYFLDAVQADPDMVDARIYGAMMCYECGDNPTAEKLIAPWRHWNALTDELRVDLAWLLTQLGDTETGEALLKQALDNAIERPRVLARLVLLRERVNRIDEAREMLELLPPPADIRDTGIRNEIINANAVMAARGKDLPKARDLLNELLELVELEQRRSNLYFGLAHVCDKLGEYDAAMDALSRAHSSQMLTAAQVVPELLAPDVEPLQTSRFYITQEQRDGWKPIDAPDAQHSPVFVVGFPRSGTTMMEQMLDAHPSMRSMDERAFLQGVVERMQRFGLTYPDQLGALDNEQCEQLRQTYWKLVSSVARIEPGQRLVDKNPLNLLRLPMICRLFPNAKIIIALRHPCDVLISCYMQSFRSPAFAVLCSSLDRLARGYVNAMKFWIRHVELLKPDMLVLRYEDLLNDFDTHVKRLGDFLELDDPSPLANFHVHARQKGFISTPSYSQVVEPPNKKAMGRWRRYERYFQPVLPTLEPIMRHWGYDA